MLCRHMTGQSQPSQVIPSENPLLVLRRIREQILKGGSNPRKVQVAHESWLLTIQS